MMKSLKLSGAAAALVLGLAALPSAAQTPPPPVPPAAKVQAMPFLDAAGMSDVFEITSSEIALMKSQNPQVRAFASMLIDHHTKTTNSALAAAKKGGVTPPAPVLNSQYRAMISELQATPAADFDRVYLAQQVPAHQGALDLHSSYARGGDNAALRMAAKSTVPIVQRHLAAAQRLMSGMGRMNGMAGMRH